MEKETKKKSKKTLLLILIPALILLFGVVGGVTYAIVTGTRAQSQHGFKVTVRGAVDAAATVEATSYLNGTEVEALNALTFGGDNATEQELTFTEALNFDQEEDVVSFVFKITNDIDKPNYTDLIIAPSYTLDDADNVSSAMYYSIDDEDSYVEIGETKYLVVHKGESIFVKIEIRISDLSAEDTTLDGTFDLGLFSEDGKPEDFTFPANESDVEYCPTCGRERA